MLKIIAQSNSPAANTSNENQKAGKVTSFLSNTLSRSRVHQRLVVFVESHMSQYNHTVLGVYSYTVVTGLVETAQTK